MTNRIPDYLKLHVEEPSEQSAAAASEFARLCAAFTAATGCGLEVKASPAADNQRKFPWADVSAPKYCVNIEPADVPGIHKVTLGDTQALANALGDLLNQLSLTREALRQREAELATGVPIVSVSADDQHLADRLEAVLRTTAEMLHCFGAGLYLLDEATSCLKLRAHVGLRETALAEPARRLEDAIADIEALAGHAVVIENAPLSPHWNVPEKCGAAICIPVATATTILGTLWFYRTTSVDFAPAEQNLAEVTAGRLASDLERNVLMQEIRRHRLSGQGVPKSISETATTSIRVTPLIDGWDVSESSAGCSGSGDFCHWHVADDDELHISVGATHESAHRQTAKAAFRAALAAHVQHAPSVAELFHGVNQTLWSLSAEGDSASLFHAAIDPTCGAMLYGLAGAVYAYVLRPHGWEPLLAEPELLGTDPAFQQHVRRQVLMPGDILLAISGGAPARGQRPEDVTNQVAEQLLRNTHLKASQLAQLATATLKEHELLEGGAILIAKRHEFS